MYIVVDWKPYKHGELVATSFSIWGSGLTEDVVAVTNESGEPILVGMMDPDAPPSTKENSWSATVTTPGSTSSYELWQLQKRRVDLRNEYLDHWEATVTTTGTGRPVDAIIAPCAPYAAPPHGLNQ